MSGKVIAMRPISTFEKIYTLDFPCYVNLGIDVDDPKSVPGILESIKNASPPFYFTTDNVNIYRHENDIFHVKKIPEEITDLEKSVEWVLKNNRANGTDKLATVSASSHKIVMHYNHGFFSGAMMMNVMREVMKPSKNVKIPLLPLTLPDLFPMNDRKPISMHYQKPTITHYNNVRVKKPDTSDILQVVSETYNAKDLDVIYDKRFDTLRGLTEYTAALYILTAKSFHDLGDKWGIQTAYDTLRSVPKFLWSHFPANCVSVMELTVDPVPSTFGGLMDRLREELNDALKTKKWLAHLRWAYEGTQENWPRLGVSVAQSNVGQIYIRKPIKDVYMRVSQEDPPNMLNLFMYSVIGEDRNVVKTHFTYGRDEMSNKEVQEVNNTFKFALQHIKRNDTIQSALQMLRDFRKSQNF